MSVYLSVAIIGFIVFAGLNVALALYWNARIPARLKTTHYGVDGAKEQTYSKKVLMMTAIFVSIGLGACGIVLSWAFRNIETDIGIGGIPQLIILGVFGFIYRANRVKKQRE